jgi:isopentenyl-diphosphate delta-isomerase
VFDLNIYANMNKDELLVQVDENDNVIGSVLRSEAHRTNMIIHREIVVGLFNNDKRVLIQQRSLNKEKNPGMWTITVAGHVNYSLEPIEVAKKELFEEIGYKADNLIYYRKERSGDENESQFTYIYCC